MFRPGLLKKFVHCRRCVVGRIHPVTRLEGPPDPGEDLWVKTIGRLWERAELQSDESERPCSHSISCTILSHFFYLHPQVASFDMEIKCYCSGYLGRLSTFFLNNSKQNRLYENGWPFAVAKRWFKIASKIIEFAERLSVKEVFKRGKWNWWWVAKSGQHAPGPSRDPLNNVLSPEYKLVYYRVIPADS